MNILICSLGMSWGVVPEICAFMSGCPDLYANHPERRNLMELRKRYALQPPDEVWICTSEGPKTAMERDQLLAWWRLLGKPFVLRVWTAQATNQLATQQECEHFRELAFRLALMASEQVAERGGQLVVSLAGGRKTMSADLQRAVGLFGADALLHVVDSGALPDALRRPRPETLIEPLSASVLTDEEGKAHLMPLVVGCGQRTDLLDIERQGRRVCAANFPLPHPDGGATLSWPMPAEDWLFEEMEARERESSALLGNYLHTIAEHEHHENWSQLYRLPTRRIQALRETRLQEGHRDWLRRLPKADLHRHLGGCLDLERQRRVAKAVWDALTPKERQQALARVGPLLRLPGDWPWTWPADYLKPPAGEPDALRSHAAAAVLLHVETDRLKQQLWRATEPRVALMHRHSAGFAAYERPGELTGSAILQHEAAVTP
ncbi:MAG: adenosine deaminase, partial [Chloroflexia bacterium]|nr:adenosine deaminase [Chloroflexia bacterium]